MHWLERIKLERIRLGELLFQSACVGCERQLWRGSPDRVDTLTGPAIGKGIPASRSGDDPVHSPVAMAIPAYSRILANHWCRHCLIEMRGDPALRCRRCGAFRDTPNPFGDRCHLCRSLTLHFDTAVSIGNYRGVLQQLILRIKREPTDVLSIQLGRLLGHCLPHSDGWQSLDGIVVMPTHWSRKLKRGFHPAETIAEGVSRERGWPLLRRGLRLHRATQKQGMLSTRQRFQNVRHAFQVPRPAAVRGKRLLVVDDVMTTGATGSEAARALRKAGATAVHIATLARGARVS